MFALLRLAMTLLICILAIGFYLGWFTWGRPVPDPQSGRVNINVSVDKNKVRSDLQRAEQTLSQRIQEINAPPKDSGNTQLSSQQRPAPRMNFRPTSVQPSGQPAAPAWPAGPFSAQPPSSPAAPPSDQPASPSQDYQFTVPLGVPPPGDGR